MNAKRLAPLPDVVARSVQPVQKNDPAGAPMDPTDLAISSDVYDRFMGIRGTV